MSGNFPDLTTPLEKSVFLAYNGKWAIFLWGGFSLSGGGSLLWTHNSYARGCGFGINIRAVVGA